MTNQTMQHAAELFSHRQRKENFRLHAKTAPRISSSKVSYFFMTNGEAIGTASAACCIQRITRGRLSRVRVHRERNDQGVLVKELWHFALKLHRTDGPSQREWNDQGILVKELWHRAGDLHRTDGPALKEVIPQGDGGVQIGECWYFRGRKHRSDRVAERTLWFVEGEEHARIILEKYYLHGLKHRIGGPARYFTSGDMYSLTWYAQGKKHRVDGPAVEGPGATKWYIHGKKCSQRKHRRKWVLQNARDKVLRAARLLALEPLLSVDVLSDVGRFL